MGTCNRKIVRDIFSHKARTALVVISIFVGVWGVVTLTSGGDLLIQQLHEDLNPDTMPMMFVGIEPENGVDLTPADYENLFAELEAYPDVTTVQGVVYTTIYWRKPDETGFIDAAASGYSEPMDAILLEPTTLVTGRYPEPGQHEVVIERRMADKYRLAVGDPVVVRVLSELQGRPGEAMAIPEETWTITGIVFDPYLFDSATQGLMGLPEDVMRLGESQRYTTLLVRFTSFAVAGRTSYDFQRFINQQTPFVVSWSWLEDPDHSDMITEVGQWTDTLQALAIIAMLVSSFLVVTVISTFVVEQRRQIGVMKSIGASLFDTFRVYAGIAVMYGGLGTIPGVILGVPAGYALAKMTAPLLPVLIESFNLADFLPATLLGLLMGLLMPFLAALLPVLLGTRVSILNAITDFGITSHYGKGFMSRVIGRLPFPITVRQAFANIYQKKGRLLMTFITLTLAGGAFMGVSAVFLSLGNALEDIFNTHRVDMIVGVMSPDDYDYDQVGALIQDSVTGLEGIYPAYGLDSEIVFTDPSWPEGAEMTFDAWLTGFDLGHNTIQTHLKAGSDWGDDPASDGIVITSALANTIGRGVGDTITLRYGTRTVDAEIIGVDKFPSDNTIFLRWQTVAALAGDTRPDSYWLRFADSGISGADVDRQIGELREELLQNGIITWFYNQRADEEDQNSTFITIALVFNIASIVMAAVGAIGLLTMLSINVSERQREIGVMRSVGASSRSVAAQFLAEGITIGVLAWVVGLPLSYGLGYALTDMLPVSELGFEYPYIAAVLGGIGMLLLAALASLWPSLSAARRTVSNILRYQ